MNDTDTLISFYNDLARLQDEGKNDEARALLERRFLELPEDVQGELLAGVYLDALVEKVEREDAIAALQEKGVDALKALDVLKRKIESGGPPTT